MFQKIPLAERSTYRKAIKALRMYFEPKWGRDQAYAIFEKRKQHDHETVDQFVPELRDLYGKALPQSVINQKKFSMNIAIKLFAIV